MPVPYNNGLHDNTACKHFILSFEKEWKKIKEKQKYDEIWEKIKSKA